ncbi:nucleoside ABC transporter membrane protein [Cognatiyoonia koreensis]|uniref:Nucleoside ABC transporter membrane protein n=1 Tax=Cognatiyoonia koreensis TaxID=364200 RepID=A0A1I0QMF0_9RHOB|nr:ABC transporter permease [Cognatiyoonia koreensis]SEW28196.1 nucleoside ABC transporter membrane protein [Cognatiyoonia koreensis]
MDNFYTIVQLGDATIRMAIPLLLACLAGLFSERAGIFDIGLEGKMLAAAFLSAAVSFTTGSVWIGLFAGIGASIMLSIVHGIASITFRGNQLISGVAINFLAAGLTVVIAGGWFGQAGRTPSLSGAARFDGIDFPGALTRIRDMRDASPGMQFYSELISGHSILVYIAFVAVPLSWWVLYRTRFGLRLRAVGENPAAVDTAGISVVQLRFAAVIICGVLCGIAGAYLSTAVQAGFTKDMTANRGFIALAALIFAKWRPWQALGACLLFGFFFAIEARFSTISMDAIWVILLLVLPSVFMIFYAVRRDKIDMAVLGGLSAVLIAIALMTWIGAASGEGIGMLTGLFETVRIPNDFIKSLPYILTVVILAGFVGKAIPPRAGGEPYVKER